MAADCSFDFPQPNRFPSGMVQTGRLAIGDFNGDRLPDLVVAGGDGISVLMSGTDGGFGAPIVTGLNAAVLDIATGDFDRDGKTDVAAFVFKSGNETAAVDVLLGRGDGTFGPPVEYYVPGTTPREILAADLDGDSRLDLVVADLQPSSDEVAFLSVLFGDGMGAFGDRRTIPSLSGRVDSMEAADFDGNGRLEVLLAGEPHPEWVRSSLTRELTVDDGPDWGGVVADVNRDGAPDIVFSSAGVGILLNAGHGRFSVADFTSLPADGTESVIAVGDLDGDRAPDVVVAGPVLDVFRGNGDGTLQARREYIGNALVRVASFLPRAGNVPARICALDFNSGDVWVWTASAGGSIPAPEFVLTSSTIYGGIFGGDYNRDGNTDIFVPALRETLLGTGRGMFRTKTLSPAPSLPYGIVADFNGDGNLDYLDDAQDRATVWFGAGDGAFSPGPTTLFGAFAGIVAAADLDHDGRVDLVRLIKEVPDVLEVRFGDGRGSFGPGISTVLEDNVFDPIVRIGDFDGDGNLDFVTYLGATSAGEPAISFFFGRRDGSFSAPVLHPVPGIPEHIAVGKFAGASRDDVAVDLAPVRSFPGGLAIAISDADRSWRDGPVYERSPVAAVADLDGDGNADLIAVELVQQLEILPGRGDGTFGTPIRVDTNLNTVSDWVASDFDGDGRTDFAISGDGGIGLYIQESGIRVVPSIIPDPVLGRPFRFVLAGEGGAAPYELSPAGGAPPPGLTFIPSTGEISGTASIAGDFSMTIAVTDAGGCSGVTRFEFHVRPTPERDGVKNPQTLPPAVSVKRDR